MNIANNTVIAKIAAVVAGLGLVAMSFASFAPAHAATTTTTTSSSDTAAQIASLQAQLAALQASSGTSASVMFNVNLTIGSRGADVTALQNWLIAKGFTIAAGATGYFGGQTKAALAAYQASVGISPAAGYFGPITRAKVNSSTTTSTTTTTTTTGGTTTTGTTSTTLSGHEANLTTYQFNNEAGLIHAADMGVKIATAQFNVTGGDVAVQRADLEFQAQNAALNVHPWSYIKSVSVWDGSKKLATMPADMASAWSDNTDDASHAGTADYYTISLTGLNDVVKQNTTGRLTFTVDAQTTIDSVNNSQKFYVDVPTNGIRAVDAAGIQQYTGNAANTVTVNVGAAQNGSITISQASDNPAASIVVAKANNQSDQYTVLAFNLRNSDSASSMLNELKFTVATSSGSGGLNLSSLIQQATLTIGGQTYTGNIINSGQYLDFKNLNLTLASNATTEGTVKVILNSQTGNYSATATTFHVDLLGTTAPYVDITGVSTGNSATITGQAVGNTQTVALSGVVVTNGSNSVTSTTAPGNDTTKSYATYNIGFDVAAVQNDAYIPNYVASSTAVGSTTSAGVVYTHNGASTFTGTSTATLTSTAQLVNGFYYVPQGTTRHFALTVVLDPTTTGTYQVNLTNVQFATTSSSLPANYTNFTVDSTDSSFKTTPTQIIN